ncbi:MAG TPA: thiamine phosphate synthase [Terriglobales bacterium]|nr:thiamine phosphate synthase [Terriglobales bacterium]
MADDRRLTTDDLLLYYITDRTRFPGSEAQRRSRLLKKIAEAARAGVDFIQLREKDLTARDLESLARDAVAALRETRNVKPETQLLINHRTDIALAVGAGGVHLRSDDISAADARALLSRNAKRETRNFLVAVSCHTSREVARAASQGADFAVFAPVFEKSGRPGSGLEALRQACARAAPPDRLVSPMPVLALGGVTLENARACLDAGAAGIAAIRLFQENHIAEVVGRLRSATSIAGVH